jgi:hypothetical protein
VLSILPLIFGLDLWSYGFISELRFLVLSCYVSFLRFILGSLIPCAGNLDFATASYAGFGQVFSVFCQKFYESMSSALLFVLLLGAFLSEQVGWPGTALPE